VFVWLIFVKTIGYGLFLVAFHGKNQSSSCLNCSGFSWLTHEFLFPGKFAARFEITGFA
jgi:hypothetical protein